MWQCFGGHQKILIIFRLNFSWSFFTYELGKPDFFENVHATKTTFGKLALHLVLLQILIFWHLILILGIFVESSPHLPLRLLLSFLLEFTRKSVLWWNKSSLEFSYRHREHCHWWWFWKKLNISGREFGGLILSLQFHRSYRIEILTQIIVLSSFTEMVLTMSSKRVYVVTNIVQFCRSYRIEIPTY